MDVILEVVGKPRIPAAERLPVDAVDLRVRRKHRDFRFGKRPGWEDFTQLDRRRSGDAFEGGIVRRIVELGSNETPPDCRRPDVLPGVALEHRDRRLDAVLVFEGPFDGHVRRKATLGTPAFLDTPA